MRISHVILRVADMARSVRFYRDAVGLPVLAEGAEFTFLESGTVRLALNAQPDTADRDRGLTEIVLEVDDVQAAFEAMRQRGVEFRVEPREVMRRDGRGLHAADFRDPDGHVLSITGWVA